MDWIAALDHEAGLLSVAARRDTTAAVPTCPGWDVDELLRHVGVAYRNAELIVRERRDAPPDRASFQPPRTGSLDWFESGRATLLETLRVTDPTTPVWTFGADRTAAFWMRRMAHETVVHRVDAELATGTRSAIEPDVAADGVDEGLNVFLPLLAARSDEPAGPTLHLHATDTEGEWLVTFGDRSVFVVHGHAKGDAAVRGPAGDLLLWQWGRLALDELEVFGDREVAGRIDRVRSAPGRI